MGNVCSSLCGSKDTGEGEYEKNSEYSNKETYNSKKNNNKRDDDLGIKQETGATPLKNGTKINKESTGNSTQKKTGESSTKGISIKDFEFLTYVGRGSYGKVALVKKISNKHYYAMKILKKKDFNVKNTVENALTEKEVLMKSKHPFVVRLR